MMEHEYIYGLTRTQALFGDWKTKQWQTQKGDSIINVLKGLRNETY